MPFSASLPTRATWGTWNLSLWPSPTHSGATGIQRLGRQRLTPCSLLYRQDRENPVHKLQEWDVFIWVYPSTKATHSRKSSHRNGNVGCYLEGTLDLGQQEHHRATLDSASFRKSEVPLHLQPIWNSVSAFCWNWNSSTLATWWEEPIHWKRHWCWERLMAWRKGGDRGWDG